MASATAFLDEDISAASFLDDSPKPSTASFLDKSEPVPTTVNLDAYHRKALSEEQRMDQMVGEVAAGASPTMPGGMMSPGFKFPRTGANGTIQRGVSETVGDIVEGALSPGGVLLAASTLIPGGPQIVGGTMAGLMAKQAGQQLGEASVTGNRQTATEGALAAVLAPLTTSVLVGPEMAKAARIRGEETVKALNQADIASRAEMRPGPVTEPITPPSIPAPAPALEIPKGTTLEDVYKRFEPEPSPPIDLLSLPGKALEEVRTGLSSKFRPLDKLAEDISKSSGGDPQQLASVFEQLAGSSGKAEADVYRFNQDVARLVKGHEADFNPYMFLRRSIDRLQMDLADLNRAMSGEEVAAINRRKVSDYTIPELQAKLALLEKQLGPETKAKFEAAGDLFQDHMDTALQLQVESGRMAPEVYADIKQGNQFYAPFKLQKYIETSSRPEGAGRKIDTVADYTKAMTGIHDQNFKLGDMLAAARRNITMSRVLAEKNVAMQKLVELAKEDPKGEFIRKLEGDEAPIKGMEPIQVLENGKQARYQVNPDVAAAVQNYNPAVNSFVAQSLRQISVPFKMGATALNIAFQPVNMLLADLPAQALLSKYGVKFTPADLAKYPLDYVHGFYSAMRPRVGAGANKLYLDFLDSGVAGSTVADFLRPEALRFGEAGKSKLKGVLNNALDFARAFEETAKVVGVKRAMRETGAKTGKALAKEFPEAITEVRRFSGSPDFWRMGKWTESAGLNLIQMFFNARLQGTLRMGRLVGADGLGTALKTNAKVLTAVGVPTVLAYLYNHLPQFAADYEKRPAWEKRNYWLIPKSTYITDDSGTKMRDYWRIPKRDVGQIVGNMVEAGMDFGREKDPAAFLGVGIAMLETLSPIPIEGKTTQERMESMLSGLNPIFKAPVEIATGRELFRHKDIIPSDKMKEGSPHNQFLDRTPNLFRVLADWMPDAFPETLRSPLLLENIIQNFTAGLITQFLPPEKPIKGREGIAASRFMKRFQAAPYTESPETQEKITELKRESADQFLIRDRTARTAIESTQTIEDAVQMVAPKHDQKLTQEEAIESEKLIRRTIDLSIAKASGITSNERQVLYLPTEQRAEFVVNSLKTLDAEQKQKLMEDWVRKRIITADVLEQMVLKIEQANPK